VAAVTARLAYTCPSKLGPYECGPVDYYVSAAVAWLFAGLVLVAALFWLYAWAYGRWQDRPAARRERALAELDRRERARQRAERPEPPVAGPPRTRPGSYQPW
jgi:hypothetical protein